MNEHLKYIEEIVNDETAYQAPENWRVGVDLGTAVIVVMVCDEQGQLSKSNTKS